MKILLTNDDGIDAPGLAALVEAAYGLGELIVVAPDQHLSGCSHQVTTHRPLEVREVGTNRYCIDGTPADCVRLALLHLAPDIDWVLSGINDGGNLGVDVWMSGTVAAAREAALLGKPAIAISQYRQRKEMFNIQRASVWTATILRELLEREQQAATFWNVNLPDPEGSPALPPRVDCLVDHQPLAVAYESRDGKYHYRGNYQQRQRLAGLDVDVCFSGGVSVTQIRLCSVV